MVEALGQTRCRDSTGNDRQLRQTLEDHCRHEKTTYSYDLIEALTRIRALPAPA